MRGAPHQPREGEMEKLKLPLDEVRIESFETGQAASQRGTVEARAISIGSTCCTRRDTTCHDVTSVFTGACNC
jgi:hypothetical protein